VKTDLKLRVLFVFVLVYACITSLLLLLTQNCDLIGCSTYWVYYILCFCNETKYTCSVLIEESSQKLILKTWTKTGNFTTLESQQLVTLKLIQIWRGRLGTTRLKFHIGDLTNSLCWLDIRYSLFPAVLLAPKGDHQTHKTAGIKPRDQCSQDEKLFVFMGS